MVASVTSYTKDKIDELFAQGVELLPSNVVGPPTTGDPRPGQLFFDTKGITWFCISATNPQHLSGPDSTTSAGHSFVAVSGCSIALSTSFAPAYPNILEVTASGAGTMTVISGKYSVIAGSNYTLWASVRPGGSRPWTLLRAPVVNAVWYNSSGGVISTTAGVSGTEANQPTDPNLPDWFWGSISYVNANAPTGAVDVALQFVVASVAAAGEKHLLLLPGMTSGFSLAWRPGAIKGDWVCLGGGSLSYAYGGNPGFRSLPNLTTGGSNIGIGGSNLTNITTEANHLAIGGGAGSAVKAGATGTTSLGVASNATDSHSTAVGFQSLATGHAATAVGEASFASGEHGVAVGVSTIASGIQATSEGYQANAASDYSTALGTQTDATALGTVAIGADHTGAGAQATTQDAFVLGTAAHKIFAPGLPTTDPHVVGQLWANNRVVTVSAG
jgi:YadA head domain repeat (2 copies)